MKRETRKFLVQWFWIQIFIIIIDSIAYVYTFSKLGDSPRDIVSIISIYLFFGFIISILNAILFYFQINILFRVTDFFKKRVKLLRRDSKKREINTRFCPKCGTEIISGDSLCLNCKKNIEMNREDLRTHFS